MNLVPGIGDSSDLLTDVIANNGEMNPSIQQGSYFMNDREYTLLGGTPVSVAIVANAEPQTIGPYQIEYDTYADCLIQVAGFPLTDGGLSLASTGTVLKLSYSIIAGFKLLWV